MRCLFSFELLDNHGTEDYQAKGLKSCEQLKKKFMKTGKIVKLKG